MMHAEISDHEARPLVALRAVGAHFARFGAPAISIAILAAAMFELHAMDWHAILAMAPASPWFWLAFALFYALPIAADWCIYRSIWGIPLGGVVAMARKAVSNDLLFGYVGETYLYTWARKAGRAPTAAFGAIKDVALLSAAVGNSVTIVIALLTAPLLARLHIGMPMWAIALAAVAIGAPPMVAIVGRKAVFHMPGRLLLRIVAIHSVRSLGGIVLTAMLWHLALPAIALSWWVVFSALKLVLSRLPFVSNKELVFAGTTAMLLGRHGDIATLMALMASLSVLAGIGTGLAVSAGGLVENATRKLGALASSEVERPA